MGKESYSSKVYKFLARNMAIDYNKVSEADFNEKMKSPDFAKSMYSFMKEAQRNGIVGRLKPYEEFVSEFGKTTPTTTTETEVVAEEETPQQGTPARTFPTPQQLKQPVTNQQLPNVGVQPQTNQPQPTPEETQIAPIDQQAGQVQGGMPQGKGLGAGQFQITDIRTQAEKPQTVPTMPRMEPIQQTTTTPTGQATPLTTPPPQQVGYFDYLGNAVERGLNRGEIADYISATGKTPTAEEFARIAELNAENERLFTSKAMQDFANNPDLESTLKSLPEIAIESIASLYRHGLARMGVGAVAGGVAGSVIPVAGTLVGAGTGALSGMSVAGLGLEVSGTIMEGLNELKIDTKNPEALKTAFSNPAVMDYLKQKAYARSIPIAALDAVSMGVAGKFLGKPVASAVGRGLQVLGEAGIQGGFGATGELLAQINSGEKIKGYEILAEGLAEIPGSIPEVGIAVLSKNKGAGKDTKVESARLALKSPDMPIDAINESIDVGVGTGEISATQATELKQEVAKAKEINAKIPAEIKDTELRVAAIGLIEERDNLNAQLETVDEAFKPAIQEKIKGINEQLQELSQIPQQQGTQAFFETNQPSQTNPLLRLPESVDAVMDKIDQGVLVSAESLFDVYNSVQTAIRETLANRAITPEERSATINILSGMLTDIDRANTEGQRFVEQVEEVSVQDRVPAVREGVKPLPQGQAPKGTATPSISQAKAIREENKRKQAGTTTLPSSGQTIITPAPATAEVATEAVAETPTGTTAEAEVTTTPQAGSVEGRNKKRITKIEGVKDNFNNNAQVLIGALNEYGENVVGWTETDGSKISGITDSGKGKVEKLGKGVEVEFYNPSTKTTSKYFVEGDADKIIPFIENFVKERQTTTEAQTTTPQAGVVGGEVENRKNKQLEIINKENPAPNNYNTWVRSVEDIKTADEVFEVAKNEGAIYPDFTEQDMEDALSKGEVVVYSSYPIKNGVFVSPSKMNAQDYAGGKGGKIYSKVVKLEDVAWIDEGQGQYAKVEQSLQTTPQAGAEAMTDRQLQDIVGVDVFKAIQRAESQLGEGVVDRNRLIDTAKKIQQKDNKPNLLPEHIFEALQYETGYPDNWQDLRNAIQKGGIDANSDAIQRQIEVGIELPTDIVEEFKKSKAYENASPELITQIEKLLTPTQDAVSLEKASSVPVQSGTTSSQEVAKGEPKAEPQSTANKGQAQATATQEEVGATPTAETKGQEGGKKSILNSDTDLKGAKETVLRNGVESTQIDKPNNIKVEDNSQRWWIFHNVITGEKIIHSEYGWDYDLNGNRLSVDYNKKVLDNNSLFKKEEPKSNLLDAILKKEKGWEVRVTESKDLAQLESIEKELQTNEKLKQAFGFNGKVYDQTGKDFYSRLNYLRNHPEKVVSENVSEKEPLVNEKLRTAISEGRMTAEDAKAIIESAGLDVPQDILAQTTPTAETIGQEETIEEKMSKVDFDKLIGDEANKSPEQKEKERQEAIDKDREEEYQKSSFDKKWAKTYKQAKEKLVEQYNKAKKAKEEWESKVYKSAGDKSVFVGGELEGKDVSVDRINQRRKENGIKNAQSEMDSAKSDLAKLGLSDTEINELLSPAPTEVTLNTPNETTIKDIEKIENATEKGRELALSKPVNKWVKRAFDSFQDLSSRAKKAGIYDGTTLKIGGKEYTVDTPAKFKAFLAQSQANFDAINEAVKDIPSEQKTDTNPSPKTVEEKSKEVFNDAKSTFVFPIGLNPKFKFDSRLPENVVRFFKKYFRPRGLWTKGMFSAKRRMENQISAQVQKSEFLVRDLRNAVKEAYPKGVTQEQLQAMNDVLQGMPREIPANLYAPLTKMREHIDELSQMMISEGIIDEKLVPVFDANMGIYTTRTYAIHNDPKSWLNYIENEPEGQQIRNNAVNFLRQATEAKADRLDKFADENEKRAEKLFRRSELAEGDEALMLQAKADEVIARADKQRQLAEALRSKDFDAYVKAYLEAEGQPLDVVRKGNVGAKDLGVLKKRKNIPDAIRALMGEEKDPLTNYTMSVAKMSALIANNQFLNEVKVQGVADGLFTNEPKGKNIEMIASASTDSMSPLNGLYTTKDIAEAFKEFDANTKSPWYIDAMLWFNAAVKVNKTVLSQGTHIRNFISNPIIELANGYIPTLKGKAIDSQMEQILNRRFGDKEKLRDYIIKLTELGVLGQGGNYRDILSVYEDLKGNKYDYQKLIEPKITGAAKKSWNIAQKVYKGGDEFWKVVAFENERAVLEKAYGDTKTSEELDQMAADIIRKTRVDYSMVPKAVKAINKIPFTGTFVTFPAEVLRIGANIPAVAYEEMNSGNKVIREHGIKRMAGYLTAMTLPYGVKELAKYLLGMDDEEEEARKKFLAPWAQNSTLIWIGKDRYIDTGFSDAFSILKKPIVAFSRGKSAAEGALSATKEFLGPVISEEIGYKTLKNVSDNTDEFGNPIYDENADAGTIYAQVSTYVLKQVEPGTVSQARRLYLGETGALSEKGQQYRTGDEVLNAVFGIKPVTINWDNAVSYKFRDAVEGINNSNKFFLKKSKELRKDDKEGRRKAAESTNLAVENAYNDLREYYTSALKIGMIPQKVDDIMKQSGVPKELAYAVKNNTGYKNYIIVLNDGTVIDRNTQRLLRGR